MKCEKSSTFLPSEKVIYALFFVTLHFSHRQDLIFFQKRSEMTRLKKGVKWKKISSSMAKSRLLFTRLCFPSLLRRSEKNPLVNKKSYFLAIKQIIIYKRPQNACSFILRDLKTLAHFFYAT